VAYLVQFSPQTQKQLISWQLPDFVLVEVYLRVKEMLGDNPSQVLVPSAEQDGGMLYFFSLVDPENRLVEHIFRFRVYYHPNEEVLTIASGIYRKQVGN
jgi:hypothetical protein